jgi:tetratricopeptide (TPR) repeat protein
MPFLSRRGWIAAALMMLVAGAVLADYWSAKPLGIQPRFVGRAACIDCHQAEADKFHGSHHDLAMDLATDETVLGDFNNAEIEHDGLVNRMFRDGDRFMVHTEGPTGKMEDFEVKYVFGVTPLQQYMVEFDRTPDMRPDEVSRVQVLRISWDTTNKRWFYLRPPDVADKLEPDDPLHWTGIAQRWQTMCADCHSTNLKRNFDPSTQQYHTTFSEIDVSCEACHGPGSLHIELANTKSLFWDRNYRYGLAALKGSDTEPQLQTCAPCHSRRGLLDQSFHAGDLYTDHYNLETLGRDTYHDDGQIKDEVYVYGSFIQSKMYHKGIRCTDCHDPHSLQLKHPGNETCTSCHQHAAGKYDVPSHHHHTPGTPGASCVNCHMPETTYMEVDPRRDHSLRIPRPDLSVKLGTPNACSRCHIQDQLPKLADETREQFADKEYADWLLAVDQGSESISEAIKATDKWCDEACETWYGEKRQKPYHFAEPLSAFRAGQPDSLEGLVDMIQRPRDVVPEIAKATALRELAESGRAEAIPLAIAVVEDLDEAALVRAAAVNLFMTIQPTRSGISQVRKTLVPLLDDPSRLVRTEAARVIVASGIYRELGSSDQLRVDQKIAEVKESLMVASDRAGAHMGWAMLCEQQGRFNEAVAAYETAIRVEPNMTGPRTNLAATLERLAQETRTPQAPEFIQRAKQLRDEELPLLKRDALLAPNNADVQYRYGLALYLAGDYVDALKQLELAVQIAPDIEVFQTAVRLLKEKLAE